MQQAKDDALAFARATLLVIIKETKREKMVYKCRAGGTHKKQRRQPPQYMGCENQQQRIFYVKKTLLGRNDTRASFLRI